MRYFRWIVVILAVAVTVLRIVLYIAKSDIDVGPTITFKDNIDTFEVKCEDNLDDLLKYVSAYDPQDGEIKDITIEKQYFLNDNKSRVTFVAIDSDNNITKASAKVIYTDYDGPKIEMHAPCIYYVSDDAKTEIDFTAYDRLSGGGDNNPEKGDISNRLKVIVENGFKRRVSGVYPAHVKVSNYYGTTREVDYNIYVFPAPFKDSIELSDYIIYCSKGQAKPDFLKYIKSSSVDPGEITIDENYNDVSLDMNTPGCYEVIYRVGEKGSETAFSRIIVVVGE